MTETATTSAPPTRPERPAVPPTARGPAARRRAGFVMIEVLVAAAVAAILIVQLVRLARDRTFGVAEVVETGRATAIARSLMTEASRRDALVAGERTGELAGHRWRVTVTPTDCVVGGRGGASGFSGRLPPEECPARGWILARIVVEVGVTGERRTSLETWRLGRLGG